MAVSSYRASPSAEISENPLGRLTSTSLLIQSWHDDLQTFFFKENGILVSPQVALRKSVVYPCLLVNCQSISLESIWVFIQPYELNEETTFNKWKNVILSNINKMKNFLLNWNSNNNINIFKIIIIDKKKSDAVRELYGNIDKSHCLQLMTSFIYLYKDIVASSSCMLEESKLLMLKELLELLPKTDDEEGDYEALKEMMLILKEEELSLEDSLSDQQEELTLTNIPERIHALQGLEAVKAFSWNIRVFNADQKNSWIQKLSSKDFICLIVNQGSILPKVGLQDALKKRSISVLVQIMVKKPMLLLKHLPLSLVQAVLKKMLKDDFIKLFKNIPIDMLINILTKTPKDLLKKVLLEIPKEVVNQLNLEISPIALREEIHQCIAELKTAYQLRKGTLAVSERTVPSLLSLVVRKICQVSPRCLVGNGALSLSSTYINQMERLHPDLQQEVCSQVRLMVNIPIIDDMLQFTFEESQGQDYLPELDLLPLASMVPGYNDFIRTTLLEKCGDKNC